MKTKLRSISPYTDYRTEQVRTGQTVTKQHINIKNILVEIFKTWL